VRLVREALQSEKRRLGVFLGAGCPSGIYDKDGVASLKHIPDVAGLTVAVGSALEGNVAFKDFWAKLIAACRTAKCPSPNVEQVLTQIRTICAVRGTSQIDGMSGSELAKLDSEVCNQIVRVVGKELPDHITAYHRFAAWIGQLERIHPVELFTPNYDLLMEEALEYYRVPFFDGFVGAREPFFDLAAMEQDTYDPRLHLAVSMRSFRAEHVSRFVKAVLDCESAQARVILRSFEERFPIVLTRNLDAAKQWVRSKTRGTERVGMVTSSAAYRMKPHAIDVRVEIDPVHWFLNDAPDPRSSTFLEDAATEFQVQGLELDWVCVAWDADFRFQESDWSYHSFVGSSWNRVSKIERRRYLKNAYRVLLTRARQGMAIFVPQGSVQDPSRDPKFYDATFEYLADLGLEII
jgi:hypothetical protein